MKKDAMIDLETMGTSHDAAIIQIGACYFNRETGEIGNTFFSNVDLNSELESGFEVDGSTIMWWLGQSEEARKSLFSQPIGTNTTILHFLSLFLDGAANIWSHATFDFVILTNHYKKLDMKPTFHYRTARDLRTLVDLANITSKKYPREGVHHNALDDCKYQVKYATACLKIK